MVRVIPLKDDVPSRSLPWVNYLLIAVSSLAFLTQLSDNRDGRASLVERFGMVPARVLEPGEPIVVREVVRQRTPLGVRVVERSRPLEAPGFSPGWTLLTSMFLHGGWMHFLGNMWFLWIFGDNVEDRFGHTGYLLFYIAAGLVAGAMHLLTNLGSTVPTIGASGAIAGVMGAYLLLYPRARVLTLVPIFFILQLVVLPSAIFLGLWFVLQLLLGTLTLGATEAGGVAWWAHIGGFVFGFAAVYWLRSRRRLRPEPVHRVLQPRRIHVRSAGRDDGRLH